MKKHARVYHGDKGKKKTTHFKESKQPAWKKELKEIETVTSEYDVLEADDKLDITRFDDIPLSKRTRRGLEESKFYEPTLIQREGIPLGLCGQDILGAAKTGSGKTLAFLIPVLEKLWRERWSSLDGLGALLVSPTRELAYQTFEVLRKVGKYHDFSGGLVIGGKDLKVEQNHILRTNIVVCTPGRLLQHMDETPNFDCGNLKILVLDEADRILDLGFKTAMNAIIENLPMDRQTLLYSATQTKSVQDLARLSLKNPKYISTYEMSATITPKQLAQSYIVCELPQKLCVLYSFLHNHTKSKTIVFFSSCKQVKFTYEAFRRLRPGVPLMALYGKQKQLRRVAIYNDFCSREFAVLFCTDIAARGLDFPAVHWVVQADCPEDANTYVHRAGRTARFEKDGQALLFLLPSEEEKFVEQLQAKKVPINKIEVNPKKLQPIQGKLEAFCAQDGEMKHWAQKSFISYVRSVYLQSNKEVFNVHLLPMNEYALSLGLVQPPKVRFLQKAKKKFTTRDSDVDSDVDLVAEDVESETDETKMGTTSFNFRQDEKQTEDEDFLTLKKTVYPTGDIVEDSTNETRKRKMSSKISQAKKLVNKKLKLNTHVVFDDGDHLADKDEHDSESDFEGGIDVSKVKQVMKKRDKDDKKIERERVRSLHKAKRLKSKPKPKKVADDSDDQEVSVRLSNVEKEESSDTDNNYIEDEQLALHLLTST
ncbi:probable ATP-dependent RNA helicase DDX10 [Dysidea avara]|uniref:probable ATP-dependent RNA helicase DDX10 n=1 Tax=Dysidea avara TaxID=196820 RepID=UPI003321809B